MFFMVFFTLFASCCCIRWAWVATPPPTQAVCGRGTRDGWAALAPPPIAWGCAVVVYMVGKVGDGLFASSFAAAVGGEEDGEEAEEEEEEAAG